MLLEIGAAILGGLANAAAGSAENDQLEKQRQQMMAYLKESIIDPDELDRMLANVNRMFNNRLVNTLNSTAIRSRGVANNNIVKGAVAGSLEGTRIGTLEQTRFSAKETNAKIRAQMVGVNLQTMPKNNFFGDFTTGGIEGLKLGMEGSKMLGASEWMPDTPIQPITDTSMDNIGGNLFEDWKDKFNPSKFGGLQ